MYNRFLILTLVKLLTPTSFFPYFSIWIQNNHRIWLEFAGPNSRWCNYKAKHMKKYAKTEGKIHLLIVLPIPLYIIVHNEKNLQTWKYKKILTSKKNWKAGVIKSQNVCRPPAVSPLEGAAHPFVPDLFGLRRRQRVHQLELHHPQERQPRLPYSRSRMLWNPGILIKILKLSNM